MDRTCKSCPWYSAGLTDALVCHHASNASTPEVSGEWWCSAHPERQSRVCLACLGLGYERNTVSEWHCIACHGSRMVIP